MNIEMAGLDILCHFLIIYISFFQIKYFNKSNSYIMTH